MVTKVAVIQKPLILLDREKTIERALISTDEAVSKGASLLVFPEAYVPGYPMWVWRLRPGGDMALAGEIHARLRNNAVDLAAEHMRPLQDAAQRHGVTIVIGIHELDSQFSGSTLFNTVVVIGPDGALLNRHRKLMPTNPERIIWGMGDASGLKVVNTPAGRLGSLICWESYMPLARYALYAQDIDIYVAPTWDSGDSWIATMCHIAKEAGCWVIGTATAFRGSDVPDDFPHREQLIDPDEWINLSGHPDVREIEKELSNVLTGGAFDLELIERNVWERLSQKPIVNQAMAKNGTQREYPVEIDPATQYDRV